MHLSLIILASFLGPSSSLPYIQQPLLAKPVNDEDPTIQRRPLQGRFLHITDLHPDLFYKPFKSTEKGIACHRGSGNAGVFGAELTDCDSPVTLVNATFQWLKDHIKGDVDFIVWTGDSARHDSDEEIPRTEKEVLDLNELLVNKFREVWGKNDHLDDPDPNNDYLIPIVPTFGNNDIMPHNIMELGPNFWTKKFSHIWRNLIPEEQKHSFDRGGWFFVEVIPKKLAVFSLNTMYFFNHNAAVDGCAKRSEPGYEQMEWLRIQLQFLRDRGMKAIMTGHVPPARTENKQAWDDTCWQKYALWMQQYRDIVVGSLYGHMNIEHFMLQDSHVIRKKTRKGRLTNAERVKKAKLGDEISIQSSREYLSDLRDDWAKIPDAPQTLDDSALSLGYLQNLWIDISRKRRKHHKSKTEKYLKKIGGKWAERYSASLVSASVVPNYFPSLRVIEYNITGLDGTPSSSACASAEIGPDNAERGVASVAENCDLKKVTSRKHKKHKKKTKKKRRKHPKQKKPNYVVPSPPSKCSLPGPAYSPQTFTWLSYKQYYANLTRINAAFEDDNLDKKKPKSPFDFEIEYDTKNDSSFAMPDLTVRSWVDLARRIGKYRPQEFSYEIPSEGDGGVGTENRTKRKGKRKSRKERKKEAEKLWFTFLRRAYVGAKEDEELRDHFGGM